MNASTKSIVLFLLAALTAAPAFSDAGFAKVQECMRANVPAALRVQKFALEATDRQGESRVLTGKLYAKRDSGLLRVMMKLDGPAPFTGASYLVRETPSGQQDEMYVFLPAVGRVRHITGAFANGPLLGTDFSYAEAKLLQNAYTGADGKLEGEMDFNGRPVYKLSIRPGASRSAPYNRIQALVDKKTCVALKADFYEGSKLGKQLLVPAESLTQSGEQWFPAQVEMSDVSSGTKTTLKAGPFVVEKDLSKLLFDPRTFNLAR